MTPTNPDGLFTEAARHDIQAGRVYLVRVRRPAAVCEFACALGISATSRGHLVLGVL